MPAFFCSIDFPVDCMVLQNEEGALRGVTWQVQRIIDTMETRIETRPMASHNFSTLSHGTMPGWR
jgi:hypothetical protein